MPIIRLAEVLPGPGQRSESAQRTADDLRRRFLSPDYADEIYGPMSAMDTWNAKPDDLMPTPDEVVTRFGHGDYGIYEDMKRNVLRYGALVEGRKDMDASLAITFLPGVDDDESKAAAEEVQDAFDAVADREMQIRNLYGCAETGFQPIESVFGVHVTSEGKQLVAPVAFIDRPINWFGFDYMNRPRFKSKYQTWQRTAELVPDYKVIFARSGSNHTGYGRGYGEKSYPSVWAIDTTLKGHMAMVERFGYMPIVATYPNSWKQGSSQYLMLKRNVQEQWKNYLLIPGEVDVVKWDFPSSEGAYAGANATGAARMLYVAKLEEWLAMFIQGSQYSSGSAQEGSFARDAVASSDRLYKAPGDAACVEAAINRGFVEPVILVNRPTLARHKWPRCSIDTSFGEDLKLLLQIFEAGVKMKFPISAITFSETFNVPMAQPGEPILEASQAPAIAAPVVDPAQPEAAPQQFGEQGIITVYREDGSSVKFFSDQMVYTEKRGPVRASALQPGDVPVIDKDKIRAA